MLALALTLCVSLQLVRSVITLAARVAHQQSCIAGKAQGVEQGERGNERGGGYRSMRQRIVILFVIIEQGRHLNECIAKW